jgi:hypothetical protein
MKYIPCFGIQRIQLITGYPNQTGKKSDNKGRKIFISNKEYFLKIHKPNINRLIVASLYDCRAILCVGERVKGKR